MKHLSAAFLVLLSTSLPAIAGESGVKGEGPRTASSTVENLTGPAALSRMLAQYDKDPTSISTSSIDAVAGQYGAVWSRLFWHTNLEDAMATARAEGKPILYLRMMGKLTDEYSCANSRFFRTVLYTNANVSKLLREKFVLVWESERPVPVITVDYGDGRVLKRTITGNSIHYVLDAEGRIVDALPGLYDPITFTGILEKAGDVAKRGSQAEERMYQSDAAASLNIAFNNDARAAGVLAAAPVTRLVGPNADDAMNRTAGKSAVEVPLLRASSREVAKAPPAPNADDAMRATMSKSGGERRLLLAATPPTPGPRAALNTAMKRSDQAPPAEAAAPDAAIGNDWSTWRRIAELHLADAQLDVRSVELIKSQNPGANRFELDATIENFQSSLAADTVRNNYEFRPRVLAWLADSRVLPTPREMNERIYSELFLTPRSDPWLGLAPENTYTALTNEGCSIASRP